MSCVVLFHHSIYYFQSIFTQSRHFTFSIWKTFNSFSKRWVTYYSNCLSKVKNHLWLASRRVQYSYFTIHLSLTSHRSRNQKLTCEKMTSLTSEMTRKQYKWIKIYRKWPPKWWMFYWTWQEKAMWMGTYFVQQYSRYITIFKLRPLLCFSDHLNFDDIAVFPSSKNCCIQISFFIPRS